MAGQNRLILSKVQASNGSNSALISALSSANSVQVTPTPAKKTKNKKKK